MRSGAGKNTSVQIGNVKLFLLTLLRVLCMSTSLLITIIAVQSARTIFALPFPILFAIGYWSAKFTYLLQLILIKRIFRFRFVPRQSTLLHFDVQRMYAFFIPYSWMCQAYVLAEWKGTIVLNWILRLLGTTIEKDVIINTQTINDWDLLRIGSMSIINDKARITGHMQTGGVSGRYINGFTDIGKGCVVHSKGNIIANGKLSFNTVVKTGAPAVYHKIFGTVEAGQ